MVSLILILIVSLFFPGIVVRTKSLLSGRKGPGIFQPIWDIIRLLQKGSVYSEVTGIIFRLAPVIYFSSVLTAILVIPVGQYGALLSFQGDFVFFAYVLALGKFFSIISALDTGSSFEGMGASREALFSMLVEPAFFVLLGSLALLTGYTSFSEIFTALGFNTNFSFAVGLMAAFVLIVIAMIENSRMPVDDPKTHLELTMIHEVMILDNSGFDLALIMHAANLKFAMYGSLIAGLFIGQSAGWIILPLYLGIQVLVAIITGALESFSARFRMSHNPLFIFTLSSVSLLIFFGVILILNKMN